MIDVAAVRVALANAVADAVPAVVAVFEVVPHHPTVLPCVLVPPPDSINYMVARGTDLAVFTIMVLVAPSDPTAQETLEGFMSSVGDLSIRTLLYADRTLGGEVSNLRLLDMTSGAYVIGTGADSNAIGAEFRVEITA